MNTPNSRSVDKVNEDLVTELISLGMSKEKAIEMASLFLFSWIKSKGKNIDIYQYEQDVIQFLDRLKKTNQK